MDWIEDEWLVFTNIIFVLVISYSNKHRAYVYITILSSVTFSSYFYHLCQISHSKCILPFAIMKGNDHMQSMTLFNLIPFIFIHHMCRSTVYARIFIAALFLLFNFVLIVVFHTANVYYIFINILGMGIVVLCVYWLVYPKITLEIFKESVHLHKIILALITGSIALFFFTFPDFANPQLYKTMHGTWHIVNAMAQIFLFQSLKPLSETMLPE